MSTTTETKTPKPVPHPEPVLRRSLGLWHLIIYGVIFIQPTAPMPVYGVISQRAQGHVITAILIALVAMLFTAISYGRMARAHPSAGSAFTYVSAEVSPALGYVTGWAMVMDYVLNPVICVIWCSKQANTFLPSVPAAIWAVFFTVFITMLNVRGIRTSVRFATVLAAIMGVVIIAFFWTASRYLGAQAPGGPEAYSRPFYDPGLFSWPLVLGGTSVAVLTYMGFDGIATLSEEVENPRRNIFLATLLTCIVIGCLSALEVYVAQLVWPPGEAFPDVDTAFVHVAGRAGGPVMFRVLGVTLLVATLGSALSAQIGAARMLYAMGRADALPRGFFGAVEPTRGVPRNGVLLVGALALVGSFVIDFSLGAELLNFGALLAFQGVNLAAFVRYGIRERRKGATGVVLDALPPLAGLLVCLLLWLSLSRTAQIAGGTWTLVGIAYGMYKTKGFRMGRLEGA
jgi:amino acid transporter